MRIASRYADRDRSYEALPERWLGDDGRLTRRLAVGTAVNGHSLRGIVLVRTIGGWVAAPLLAAVCHGATSLPSSIPNGSSGLGGERGSLLILAAVRRIATTAERVSEPGKGLLIVHLSLAR